MDARKLAQDAAAKKEHCYAGEAQIVDDETGKPIEQFTVQDRLPDLPNAPGEVRWGGGQTSSGFRDGTYSIGWEYVRERHVELRVFTVGYLPQPFSATLEKDGLLKPITEPE